MHCVDFFLSCSFARIYLSVCKYNPPDPIKTKVKYVKNAQIFKTSTKKNQLST